MQRPGRVVEQELGAEEIEEDVQGSRQSVVGLPVPARWIADWDLRNPGSRPGGQRRDKTMQFTVKRKVLNGLSTIRLERRAKIVKWNS